MQLDSLRQMEILHESWDQASSAVQLFKLGFSPDCTGIIPLPIRLDKAHSSCVAA